MATFLASLDGTIIATALPKIASDFKAQSQMSWVATAYLLTYSKCFTQRMLYEPVLSS